MCKSVLPRKRLDETVSAEESQARFAELIDRYRQLFARPFRANQVEFLQKDVRELVLHINDRINYWEERRTLFLQIGLAMLGFGSAGLGAIAVASDKMLRYPVAFVTLVTLAFTFLTLTLASVSLLRLWNAQNNPSYPFTKVATTWRWLYRYAEPEQSQVQVWVEPPSRAEFDDTMRVYLENLINYAEKTLALDRKGALEQDLAQLYLLLINEKYKIKFITMLRERFWACLNVTLLTGSLALVLSSLFVVCGWYSYLFAATPNAGVP